MKARYSQCILTVTTRTVKSQFLLLVLHLFGESDDWEGLFFIFSYKIALIFNLKKSMEESTDCIADYLVINYGQYTSGKLCGTSADIYEDWTFHFGSSFDIT